MSTDSAARVVTIIGLIFNILALILTLIALIAIGPLIALLLLVPGMEGFVTLFIVTSVGNFLLVLIVGLILPLAGYGRIRPESKGKAAGILVVSGVIGLLFVSLIGGVLVLLAGILVAAWHPFAAAEYAPSPAKSLGPPPSFAAQPDIAPTAKSVTPKSAKYCVACGAELQGDERYCPVCGGTIG